MTTIDLTSSGFPTLERHVHAKWAPILLQPISGSYERLVVGCAVVNDSGFHLETANALQRLKCLYADRADGVAFVVEVASQAIQQDLAKRGIAALTDATSPLSGIHIGSPRDAEGSSLEAIAKDWMSVLSSLYEQQQAENALIVAELVDEVLLATRPKNTDRLPQLVLEKVSNLDLSLARHFSERIIEGRSRRRSAAHKLDIDYKGKRLVANFATLNAARIRPAVGNIKQRLWDLKIDREQDIEAGKNREHELIVQVPRPDDPQVSDKQYKRLKLEYDGLLEQADKLKLILREFNTPSQIGEHIVKKEAA